MVKKLLLAILICVLPFLMGPTPRAGYRPMLVYLDSSSTTGASSLTVYTASNLSYDAYVVDLLDFSPNATSSNKALGMQLLDKDGGLVDTAGTYETTLTGNCGATGMGALSGLLNYYLLIPTTQEADETQVAHGSGRFFIAPLEGGDDTMLRGTMSWITDAGETPAGDPCIVSHAGRQVSVLSDNIGGVRLAYQASQAFQGRLILWGIPKE